MPDTQIKVNLTEDEYDYCIDFANKRNNEAIIQGKISVRKAVNLTDLEIHKIGVLGEYAFKKHFNISQPLTINNYENPDFGNRTDVKTKDFNNYSLYYHNLSHNPDYVYVACKLEPDWKSINIIGWIEGIQAVNGNFKVHRGAYVIPYSMLNTNWSDFPEQYLFS